jgi:hypothetical protein
MEEVVLNRFCSFPHLHCTLRNLAITSHLEFQFLCRPSADDALVFLRTLGALQDYLLPLSLLLHGFLAGTLAAVAHELARMRAVSFRERAGPSLAHGFCLMHLMGFAKRTVGIYLFWKFHRITKKY